MLKWGRTRSVVHPESPKSQKDLPNPMRFALGCPITRVGVPAPRRPPAPPRVLPLHCVFTCESLIGCRGNSFRGQGQEANRREPDVLLLGALGSDRPSGAKAGAVHWRSPPPQLKGSQGTIPPRNPPRTLGSPPRGDSPRARRRDPSDPALRP